VKAVLLVAGYELMESLAGTVEAGKVAKVVHHAVEKAKRMTTASEAGLVNAVLRKLADDLVAQKRPAPDAGVPALTAYYSHPEWLIQRWQRLYGESATVSLLEWNQRTAESLARLRKSGTPAPEGLLLPTAWEGFWIVAPGRWKEAEAMIEAGLLYIQDPATRLSAGLLGVAAGEKVLDLCAAPGGKAVMLADQMGTGTLVAVDLPGDRIERLRQNLGRVSGVECRIVEADLCRDLPRKLREIRLPVEYQAVLVDVPCSNTGVMRHRVDVKDRLQEGDFKTHARQQREFLGAAARLVAPGGRLVYSTCSIDPSENEEVVQAFLASTLGHSFTLARSEIALPWVAGHDGAAAFLLLRKT
jgi:16S rRNA (cytosine967-C5)-methyltransferase